MSYKSRVYIFIVTILGLLGHWSAFWRYSF